MDEPRISIIIPARNAGKTIERCLNSILNLDYGNYEVIVVDDGSEDKTAELLKKYLPRINIITNSSSAGPSRSRNAASLQTKGEYLAFTDADCMVDKNWLKELLLGLSTTDIVSVGGRQEIPEDETDFGRLVSRFMKKIGFISDYMHRGKEVMLVRHNSSCNVMYKREIFLKEGGFLEGLWPGEDVELDYRLKKNGYKLIFNPGAIVYHYRPDSLKKFLGMMYRYGWAQGVLARKYGIFRKIQVLPIITLILAVLTLSMSLWNLKIVLFVAALLFIYFCFIFSLVGLPAIISWHIGFMRGLSTLVYNEK